MSFVEKRKKKFGDRKDGHRLKDIPQVNRIMVHIYPNRCDCEVSATTDLDITNLMNYIKIRKTKDPQCQIKFFHCFIAALVRTLNERRQLLRFVQNKRLYEKDTIRISFVAKRAFNDKVDEAIINYIAKKDDNVDAITNFVINEVSGARDENKVREKEKSKWTIESLKRFPDFMIRILGWILRHLDKHGWLSFKAMAPDPSFATVLIANLGSIGQKSVYHHLNNYGTCSIMITIGKIFEKEVKMPDGHIENRTFVDTTAIFDERIADGFYFVKSMQLMQQYLDHPETLEKTFDEDVKF